MQGFEYAFLGGSLLLSVALLFVCLLFFSFRKGWASRPGRHVGVVETRHLGWIDMAGVGLIFAIYLGNWIDLGQIRSPEFATTGLLVSQLVLQLAFIGVVLGVLYRRVDLTLFWGLRPGRYWWVIGVTFTGFIVYSLILEGLWALGFEDWTARVFRRVADPVAAENEVLPVSIYLWGLVTVVAAPLTEEIVFRGYLYPVLKRMGGIWLAALTVSLFFAAAHLDGAYLLGRFLLSLILIAAYELTGSIWAPVGIHFLNNGFVFSGSFLE
ncbi:CPBP family intramembrane glutamic endopeptidase [Roseibacillus persicicus]|uniref:CPBP family intramembrane glutamic endopeptidase n=1 Tax=Roseibacillus persicicus TaxID=454148 RepID=UPI00280D22AD|nr:type II CAAX endopeptidase family protein [Roseibacillus persicicus]MDQ8190845.1 type II CAAX endopeptidase family protein [Roseibacillus persicicus]